MTRWTTHDDICVRNFNALLQKVDDIPVDAMIAKVRVVTGYRIFVGVIRPNGFEKWISFGRMDLQKAQGEPTAPGEEINYFNWFVHSKRRW